MFLVYRVIHLLGEDLGWVDFDFSCSTICPILLGLLGIWQNRLGSWARLWNTQIKVNPTKVLGQMNHQGCDRYFLNVSKIKIEIHERLYLCIF